MQTEMKKKLMFSRFVRVRKMGGWRTLNFILLISALALTSYLSYKYFTAEPAGYCSAQKRYIPDTEFIRTANALYAWEMNIDRKLLPEGTISKKKDDDKEKYQRWERNRDQPGCCHVYRGGTQSTFNRMFGLQEVDVTLYTDPENSERQLPFLFDVCGKVLPAEFGYEPAMNDITTSNYQNLTKQK